MQVVQLQVGTIWTGIIAAQNAVCRPGIGICLTDSGVGEADFVGFTLTNVVLAFQDQVDVCPFVVSESEGRLDGKM